MSEYFSRLYDYDSTVNRQLLEHLRGLDSIDEESPGLLAHILASKNVWITRLNGEDSSDLVIWPELSWDECAALITSNREAYQDFLAGLTDEALAEEVQYQNSSGTVFETPARDILTHVLVHGGHHRGQIAQNVRRSGGEPINTDYITYVRNLV